MGVDAKRLFFWSHSEPETISHEQKAYQKWVFMGEKKLEEAHRSKIYPRFQVNSSANFHTYFEVRQLPDTTFVISVLNAIQGRLRLDSAVVLLPSQSVHLLDSVIVPGDRPKFEWEETHRGKQDALSDLEFRFKHSKLYNAQTEGKWTGGFQPTSEILSALHTK